MVFSSHVFLFYFLPLVLGLYYIMPRRGKHLLLIAFSYVFYGWANPWFVFLMAFSTLVDFYCGKVIVGQRIALFRSEQSDPGERVRKLAVATSVIANLSLLGFFKYFPFVQENMNWVLTTFGRSGMDIYEITLPLGISFYTFQSMSYTIDLYRGDAEPAESLLDFACYVSLFPQLVAGPIVRYRDLADQLRTRRHTVNKFSRGISFFILGFAKKVVLANPMGMVADTAFGADALLWHDAWIGVLAYAFQIYFDFSGYSDMAIGLGLMLGFSFPKNFNAPYLADSITDFWQRWHMSLSTWLRDYLYIPLGGNRKSTERTYVNLMLVMLLGGLWHGASWNFVIWGAIHGGMLGGERLIGKTSAYAKAPRVLRTLITFIIVLIAWVFFRAPDLDSALTYLASMFGFGDPHAGAAMVKATLYAPYYLMILTVCAVLVWLGPQSWNVSQRVGPVKAVLLVLLFAWTICIMWTQTFNPFIYFIF